VEAARLQWCSKADILFPLRVCHFTSLPSVAKGGLAHRGDILAAASQCSRLGGTRPPDGFLQFASPETRPEAAFHLTN